MKWNKIEKALIQIKRTQYLKEKGYTNFNINGKLINSDKCSYNTKRFMEEF
jgi:hypothetical protein